MHDARVLCALVCRLQHAERPLPSEFNHGAASSSSEGEPAEHDFNELEQVRSRSSMSWDEHCLNQS